MPTGEPTQRTWHVFAAAILGAVLGGTGTLIASMLTISAQDRAQHAIFDEERGTEARQKKEAIYLEVLTTGQGAYRAADAYLDCQYRPYAHPTGCETQEEAADEAAALLVAAQDLLAVHGSDDAVKDARRLQEAAALVRLDAATVTPITGDDQWITNPLGTPVSNYYDAAVVQFRNTMCREVAPVSREGCKQRREPLTFDQYDQ